MSSTASNTIATNIIDTTTAGALTIGNTTATSILLGSSTAGRTPTIVIDTLSVANTNADPAIAIGTSSSVKTIKLGIASSSVHCSSLDIKGSAINNISNATGNISIGDLQTDGILNLGAGTLRTATGVINIGNPSATIAPIVIGGSSVKLAINGSYGTAGQVLTSGGSGATMTWGASAPFSKGAITVITNGALTAYTFPTPIPKTVSVSAPDIIITGANGGTNLIVPVTVGVVTEDATNWTGFSYVTSGAGLTRISWIALYN